MKPITPGTLLIDRYLVAEKLGVGGNGAVWAAHDRVLDRPVAVKVVTGGAGAARLAREARTTAQLDAREVVAIYDHGEQDGAHFLVMELVEGTDLAALLVQTGGLPTSLVALIGRDLARGLAAMHEAGLVHRDMTPANVLLSATGEVKLTDLGIARGVDSDDERRLTEVGTIVGTVDYLAPEQLEDSQVVAATDVYALGLLLHHAATGSTPFGEGSVSERIARRIARDPAPLPDEMGSSELAAIVAGATRRSPADRYPDGASLAAALQGLLPLDDQTLRDELGALVAGAIASRSEQQTTTVIVTPPDAGEEGGDADEAPGAAPAADEPADEPATEQPAAAGTLVLDVEDVRFDAGVAPTTAIPLDGLTTAVPAPPAAAEPAALVGEVAPTTQVVLDGDQDDEHPWTWVAVVAGSIAVLVALLIPAIQGGGDGEGEPAAEAPATLALPIAGAVDHDPLGGGDEHPEDVGLAIDGNAETEWDTEGYDSVALGGLKSGVGLLIDLGQAADVGAVEIDLGSAGVDLTVLVSAERPSGDPLSEATPLGAATAAEGTVRLEGGPINGRWVSVWFTRLGDGPGRARAAVREVRVLAPEG